MAPIEIKVICYEEINSLSEASETENSLSVYSSLTASVYQPIHDYNEDLFMPSSIQYVLL